MRILSDPVTLLATYAYTLVSVMTLLALLANYFTADKNIKMSRDFQIHILRTYITYFVVLIIMETPNIPVYYLKYQIFNPHEDET